MKSKTLTILILGSLATVSPFSIDMYLPSFSLIAGEFGTTPARVSLSISSYFVGLAIGQMVYGPLLDRFGRKTPLYLGLLLFIIASIGCMISTSIEMLIFFRFVQALGGCAASVASMAMVRDFFHVDESAKVFSLLILILGVSPLLAPTIGGFITDSVGWKPIFLILGSIVACILITCWLWLPAARPPDKTISLRAGPMVNTFLSILRVPQFIVYTLAAAFSFATLFVYVAGSPVIFMEGYHITPKAYGGIFAMLSVGFIGSNQLNILALKYFPSQQIFKAALTCQVLISVVFLLCAFSGWLTLYATIAMFFAALSCLGFIYPNGTALALAPFTKNVGSAAALIGCIQIGVAAIASATIGLFNSSDILPATLVMLVTCATARIILLIGKNAVRNLAAPSDNAAATAH